MKRCIKLIEKRHPDRDRGWGPRPVRASRTVTPRREKDCRTVLACVRTTELLVRVQLNAQNVVPELPKKGRVMHFFAVVAVEARVGISLRAKFFPTGLWKFP